MTLQITSSPTSALILLSATLIACGGGSSNAPAPAPSTTIAPTTSTTTPPTTTTTVTTTTTTLAPTLANAQGFWSAALSGTASAGAVILPNGQTWVIYQSGSTVTALAQTALSLTGSTYLGTGKYYGLPAGAVQDYKITGTIPAAKVSSILNSTTIGTGSPTALTWTYNSTYETAAIQTSVQGHWTGALDADSLAWDINATGTVSGTSTTGCTYSGTIRPNASPVAVFDAAITENCAGTIRTLTGIATLNAAKNGMSLAYTTGAGVLTQGGAIILGK